VISWLLTVGWETVLVILATLATATVFHRLGWGGGDGTKVVALIIVVALTIFGGVMGFDLIMRLQTWITIVTGVFTVVFIALAADHIHWHAVSAIHSGSAHAVIGIGALATLLPTWFLVPFAIVALLGLIGGSVLDIYSSGLALLTLGMRLPRYKAALIDGTVMTLGTI